MYRIPVAPSLYVTLHMKRELKVILTNALKVLQMHFKQVVNTLQMLQKWKRFKHKKCILLCLKQKIKMCIIQIYIITLWMHFHISFNLLIQSFFSYFRCRDAQENNNESFLPCAFGVVRVKMKVFWQNNTIIAQVKGLKPPSNDFSMRVC